MSEFKHVLFDSLHQHVIYDDGTLLTKQERIRAGGRTIKEDPTRFGWYKIPKGFYLVHVETKYPFCKLRITLEQD